MAKAVITLTDNDDGTIGVHCNFDPAIKERHTESYAQLLAFKLLKVTQGVVDDFDYDEDE